MQTISLSDFVIFFICILMKVTKKVDDELKKKHNKDGQVWGLFVVFFSLFLSFKTIPTMED